ncbi:YggT family protein [candidate division KSB1 bacterium]|nr:YggT family protein [candidate division KSB1 bacterium]NIR68671.1 YggT family protein [candidate division KSB1 bacterium]NIS27160.1 YggT family protein [candidate division KSB1 bacterium]NIT74046.1 YggT family protein [candidate division KSB1 bacterium]NIU27912.1 YggT family protein [candidate division KSB1 bacterium]
MFMLSSIFLSIAKLIDFVITLYIWLVIIRVILSWISVNLYNPFVRFLLQITEPMLSRIRRWVPDLGGLDISPVILIFGLYLIRSILVAVLEDLAFTLS